MDLQSMRLQKHIDVASISFPPKLRISWGHSLYTNSTKEDDPLLLQPREDEL